MSSAFRRSSAAREIWVATTAYWECGSAVRMRCTALGSSPIAPAMAADAATTDPDWAATCGEAMTEYRVTVCASTVPFASRIAPRFP